MHQDKRWDGKQRTRTCIAVTNRCPCPRGSCSKNVTFVCYCSCWSTSTAVYAWGCIKRFFITSAGTNDVYWFWKSTKNIVPHTTNYYSYCKKTSVLRRTGKRRGRAFHVKNGKMSTAAVAFWVLNLNTREPALIPWPCEVQYTLNCLESILYYFIVFCFFFFIKAAANSVRYCGRTE